MLQFQVVDWSIGKDDYVKTSSFRTYTGPGRISIARFAPRGHPAGYPVYSKLAPGPWFNKVSIDEYCRLYGQILAGRDPQRTYDELVALTAPAEPVLLCYEVPPFSAPQPIPQAGLTTIGRQNWCHRRLVAVWFQETLGIEVAELELPHGSLAATRHARGPAIPREPPSHVDPRPGVEPDGPVVRLGGAIDKALLL